MLLHWKKIKSVPYVMDSWIMSIIQWKNGMSKDFCAVSVIQKKSSNTILELMKE
jgi:hypothetical protein